MRAPWSFTGWVAAVLVISSCGDPADEPAPDDDPEQEPVNFFPLDFETKWPEVRNCRPSPAEHDGYSIRVFVNPKAESAYLDGVYPFKAGTLIVKGEYDDESCAELSRVSAMKKLPAGEKPSLGDWQWQRTTPHGLLIDTPQRSCKGCHSSCETSDYACTDP